MRLLKKENQALIWPDMKILYSVIEFMCFYDTLNREKRLRTFQNGFQIYGDKYEFKALHYIKKAMLKIAGFSLLITIVLGFYYCYKIQNPVYYLFLSMNVAFLCRSLSLRSMLSNHFYTNELLRSLSDNADDKYGVVSHNLFFSGPEILFDINKDQKLLRIDRSPNSETEDLGDESVELILLGINNEEKLLSIDQCSNSETEDLGDKSVELEISHTIDNTVLIKKSFANKLVNYLESYFNDEDRLALEDLLINNITPTTRLKFYGYQNQLVSIFLIVYECSGFVGYNKKILAKWIGLNFAYGSINGPFKNINPKTAEKILTEEQYRPKKALIEIKITGDEVSIFTVTPSKK